MSKDNDDYYYDKGQKDGSEGDYKRPHGIIEETFSERSRDDNAAYNKGYEHAKGQRDGAENKYRPPSKTEEREIYDAGWDNARDQKKSGCFLTTACIATRGLSDDCEELVTLRGFRDSYLRCLPEGEAMIEEYYTSAPVIVEAIDKSGESEEIYAWLYEHLVLRSVELIRQEKNSEALMLYGSIFTYLSARYVRQLERGFHLLG